MSDNETSEVFAIRFYTGHTGKFGHEFMEIEVSNDGWLRYANKSQYKKSATIRKEVQLGKHVLDQLKTMARESGILNIDEEKERYWPESSVASGKQELEIVLDGKNLWLATAKLKHVHDIDRHEDAEALKNYFTLCQEFKAFAMSLVNLHFKVNPFG